MRKLIVPLVTAALVASGVGQEPAFAAPPRPRTLTAQQVPSVHGTPVVPKTRPAQLTHGAANPAPVKVTWPAAGSADVAVRTGTATRAGTLPVYVTAVSHALTAAAPSAAGIPGKVHVDLLDRATVPAGWRDGPVLRLAPDRSGTVRVGVDYSAFAGAYGADYASRLRLVSLPACALAATEPAGCRVTPLATTDDAAGRQVTADVLLAAATPAVVAVTTGPSGNAGSFAATALSPSSNWSAGGNAGNFSWNYSVATPPALGGPGPGVALSYSSSSVDGRNATTNNQPGWIGEGFDYSPGFISRSYKGCADDEGSGANNTTDTGDLCWGTDNAFLSMNGHSGELVKDDKTGAWHLKDDDNTTIVRHTDTVNADHDHEYWVLTTDDGTQYYFGLNRLPGYTGTAPANKTTDSVWTVPVAGNNDSEPCHASTFLGSFCDQAWQWNLDYVKDPHGNTMSYFYTPEGNHYARNLTDTDAQFYDRGGFLDQIDYGTADRAGTDTEETSTSAPMQVQFKTTDRCLADCTTHDVSHWPDTPWDQSCTSSTNCKGIYSPTFFLTQRLNTITTQVWDAGTAAYKNVDLYTLTQSYPNSGDDTRNGLWLSSIQRTGEASGGAVIGGNQVLPAVSFDWTQMANRVDTLTDHEPAMNWMRLSTIWTETGEKISVRYEPQQCIAGSVMPGSPQNNTLRCYPVLAKQPDKSIKTEYFNKYPVQAVTEEDETGGGPDVTTTYTYPGSPAWRHADDDGLTPANLRTWSEWRGYGQVNTQVGIVGGGNQTLSESTYFQGMNGDQNGSGGTRSVSLPALDVDGDGSTTGVADAPAVPDEDAYSGMVRRTTVYNGVESAPVSTSVDQPWESAPTATRVTGASTVYARHTGNTASWDATKLAAGGWRVTHTTTGLDADGMPTQVDDQGDVKVTGDEKCTTTSYARNTGANILGDVDETDSYALSCAQVKSPGPTSDADVISMARTLYDHQGFGVAPTLGDVTETDTAKAWSTSGATWLTNSTSAYDAYGRPIDVTDVRGNHTQTAYTPAGGGPLTQTDATTSLGTTTTVLEPSWQAATAVIDINGKRIDETYDAMGRVKQVWKANHTKASFGTQPSITYDYLIRATGGANAVTANELNTVNTYTTSIDLYDGLLRQRQKQSVSLANGHVGTVFSDTTYDDEGRAATQSKHYDSSVQPSTTLFAIASWQPLMQTATQYDRAGRTTATIVNSQGVEQYRTTTTYGGDRVSVVPPLGGTATTTITDALGRTTAVRQYHAAGDAGSDTRSLFDQITYHYNRKGQKNSWTDNAGNTWTATYDLQGRQTAGTDPDTGASSSTYDDAGDLLTTTDNRNQTLAYAYDALGRKTGEYQGSITGTELASWSWDPTGATGQLASSSRFVGTDEYKISINGYTALYQPTGQTYTIPASQTGLAGSYSFGSTYKVDGSPGTSSYPSGGGLGSETLTDTYDPTDGLAEGATTNSPGLGQYVTNTDYTAYGEVTTVQLQTTGGSFVERGLTYDAVTHRLAETTDIRQTGPQAVNDTAYQYDAAGNVTRIADTGATGGSDRQCFAYDYARRLTTAWTPSSGDCGQALTSASSLGGPAPYWQSWTFDADGNRGTETDHTTAGDTTATYTYGSTRPNAVTSVSTGSTTASYGYDAVGDTTSRPGPTAAQTLTWDAEGNLSTVTENGKTTRDIYDADGNLLIEAGPSTTTLYLPGEDITRTSGTGAVSAVRYYSFAGGTGAQFDSATGKLTWLLSDQQATQSVEVDNGTQAINQRRETPYGSARGTATAWPNDRGFVGGIDQGTGLVHEGAREYDPTLGAFISADPLVLDANAQQLQGYGYSGYSPVTNSDPSGAMFMAGGDGGGGGGGGSSSGCTDSNCGEQQINRQQEEEREKKARKKTSSGCHDSNCGEQELSTRRHASTHHTSSGCGSANACEEEQRVAAQRNACVTATACEHRQEVIDQQIRGLEAMVAATVKRGPKTPWYHNKWVCAMSPLMCTTTVGICPGAFAGVIGAYSAQGCMQFDKHGMFFTYTDVHHTGKDPNFGIGATAGISLQLSNATNKNSLSGKFGTVQGFADDGGGGVSWGPDSQKSGHEVIVADGGLYLPTEEGLQSASLPLKGSWGASGGQSNTFVSGYMFHWCTSNWSFTCWGHG